ncbi:MAG: hypothetical protein KDB00_12230 [Planctomycetales bacterium]|nr:hypothetical protein [Planctomycetales bacterium]
MPRKTAPRRKPRPHSTRPHSASAASRTASLLRDAPQRRRLLLELLERRDLLAAGTNYVVLDFTPDDIPGELQPQPFIETFTTVGRRNGFYPQEYSFLDYNEDGSIDELDADLAADAIGQDVYRRLKPLIEDPSIDLRLLRTPGLQVDANVGYQFLQNRIGKTDENAFVIYIGGDIQTALGQPVDSYDLKGVSQQAFAGINHEWYGFALAEKTAESMASHVARGFVGNWTIEGTYFDFPDFEIAATGSDGNPITFRVLEHPDPDGIVGDPPNLRPRIEITSGNFNFLDSQIIPGDRLQFSTKGIEEIAYISRKDFAIDIDAIIDGTSAFVSLDYLDVGATALPNWDYIFANGITTTITRRESYSPKDYTEQVSWAVVHELGHLWGLGHICNSKQNVSECGDLNPERGKNVMNYKSPVSTNRFVNVPTPYATEVIYEPALPIFDPSSEYITGINHRQAVVQSLTFIDASQEFEKPSSSGIYPQNLQEAILGSLPVSGLTSTADTGDSFFVPPVRELPPAATQGTVGTTSPADIANAITSQFASLKTNLVDSLASLLDLNGATLPGISGSLGDLVNLRSRLDESVSTLDVSSAVTMSAIADQLAQSGFSIDHLVSDTEFSNLAIDAPADFIRFSKSFEVPGLLGSTGFDSSAASSLASLSAIGFSGEIGIRGRAMLSITAGVDSHGFYILPGEAIRFETDADANLTVGLATAVSAAGTAAVDLYATVEMQPSDSDGRIRIDQIVDSFPQHSNLDFLGAGALNTELLFTIADQQIIEVPGSWLWEIDESGTTLLDDYSGFHQELIDDQLATKVAEILQDLELETEKIANEAAKAIPFLSDEVSERFSQVIGGSLGYDNSLGSDADYLRDRGFSITTANAMDFVNGSLGTNGDLIRIAYNKQFTPTWSAIPVGGEETIGPANLNLQGTVNLQPQIDIGLVIGFDLQNGPYLAEGAKWSATLSQTIDLAGNVDFEGLVGVSVNAATLTFPTLHATFAFDDGDQIHNEKFYLGNLSVAPFVRPEQELYDVGTEVKFDFALAVDAANLPGVGNWLSGQTFQFGATGTYDLALQTGTVEVDQTTLDGLIQPLTDIRDLVLGDFVGKLEEYNPLTKELRDFLTDPIELFQSKSLLEMLGLGSVEFLIDPSAFENNPNPVSNSGDQATNDHVLLNYDLIQLPNIAALLMGRPANLFSLDIDKTFDELKTTFTVVPSTLIGSYFGVANTYFGVDVTLELGFGIDTIVGLDTRGFYVKDDPDPLVSVSGSISAVPTITGALVVEQASVAEITGQIGITATGGIDLQGATSTDQKIRASEIFPAGPSSGPNTDLLAFTLAFDLTWDLFGSVGFGNLTKETDHYDGQKRLFELNSKPGQPGSDQFDDLVRSMENLASQLKYCSISSQFPNPATELACVDPDIADQLDKIARDPEGYLRDRGLALSNYGKEKGKLVAQKWQEFQDGISDFANRYGLPDPIAGVNYTINELSGLWGSKDWEYHEPPSRGTTFNHRIDGDSLYVTWSESHRAGRGWNADQMVYDERLPAGYVGTASPWLNENQQPIIKVHTNGWFDYLGTRFHVLDDEELTTTEIGDDIFIENSPNWVDVTVETLGLFGVRSVTKRAPEYVQIRWDATSKRDGSDVQVAARIFYDGRVQFDYGSGNTQVQAKVGITFAVDTPDASFHPLINYHGQNNLSEARSVQYVPSGSSYSVLFKPTSEFSIVPLYGAGPFPTDGTSPTDFTIDQANPAAANLHFGLSQNSSLIIIDAPDFVTSELVATRKSGCFDGCETEEQFESIRHANRLEIPVDAIGRPSISKIVISGSNQPDIIVADANLTIPVVLYGNAGNDTLAGTSMDDTIYGGLGDDILQGRGGNDDLYGEGDNDNLIGDYGNDLLDGGEGDDFLNEEFAIDVDGFYLLPPSRDLEINTLLGGAGDDVIWGSPGKDIANGGLGKDAIEGNSGDDILRGGPDTASGYSPDEEADVIFGGTGNNILMGGIGNDYIEGGPDRDVIFGSADDDVLLGQDGDDELHGGPGNDLLEGGPNDDDLYGGLGADIIRGQAGNDLLVGALMDDYEASGDGNDVLHGGNDDDDLYGGPSGPGLVTVDAFDAPAFDILNGDAGNDRIWGGSGPDRVNGGRGFDLLWGDQGDDTLNAGAGGDEIIQQYSDIIRGGDQDDTIFASTIAGDSKGTWIDAGPGDDVIAGNSGPDRIIAGPGNDTISSLAGDDTVFGHTIAGDNDDGGEDWVDLGPGADWASTGDGNDFIIGGAGGDVIYAGWGRDTVYAGLESLVPVDANFQNIIYGDPEDLALITGTDTDHSDTLYGTDGQDTVMAGPGDNRVFTYAGNDSIESLNGNDVIDSGADDDTISSGDGNDTITGGLGSDVIQAGWGADLIYSGADEFGFGNPTDIDTVDADPKTLSPFPGNALDHGDVVYGSIGMDIVFAGLGNNVVTTFAGTDSVQSEDGNDEIDTGSGNDTISSGGGDDTITAGLGSDLIEAGWGADLIYSGADELGTGNLTDVDTVDADPKTLSPFPGNELDHGDVVYGSVGTDIVFAGLGKNVVTTFAGTDSVQAEDGNDEINTGSENDTISSGGGDDTITAGLGSDLIEAGWGSDLIYTGTGPLGGGHLTDIDLVHADPETFTIIPAHPTMHADVVVGSIGSDTVYAGPGNDFISTLDGNDFVEGQSGADEIDTGDGDDIAFGHTQDRADDDGANDTIRGGDGDDQIWGGYGDDSLDGGSGNDRIVGEWGDDAINGGDDDDLILAGHGNDSVDGGAGNDRIEAGHGNDTVTGGSGNDVVLGQQGDDSIRGGADDDDLRGGPGLDWIDGEAGNDLIDAGSGVGQHLFGGPGDDVITGSSDGASIDPDFFDTTFFGDVIDAGPGNDTVYGLGGADLIRGGDGDDHIESGTGRDHVIAGDGNDWVFVGFDLGEVVYAGEGNDTVIGSDSGDDELYGEGGQDDLFGQGGNDTLKGGLGADLLDGGAGVDRIEGEEGDDELRGGGGDGDQLLGGPDNDLLVGSDDGGDFFSGNGGRDTLLGGGGNDNLSGDDGDDVLRGGAGDDVIIGGLGADVITGDGDHDILYGHYPPWVFDPVDDNKVDYLYGDFGTNQNEVGSGHDQLDGGGGNDLLFGEGDDDLIVSTAGDLVDYGDGESAIPSDFVAPAVTPDPSNASVAPMISPELPVTLIEPPVLDA